MLYLVRIGPVNPAGIWPFIDAFLDDGISGIPALLPLLIARRCTAIEVL
jgi:hypothetical protein